ncbi:MAG TPA: helix-turn-helix domain-containing protein [Anaeromyxobacteraceae bacterium]|nr:helix-turn-helix domain-containing protein [Anaeromyxobacteraceae bacterium]
MPTAMRRRLLAEANQPPAPSVPCDTIQLSDEYEVERETRLPVKTLRNMRWKGGGPPFYKLGKAVRYDIAEVRAWIRAHRIASTSATA